MSAGVTAVRGLRSAWPTAKGGTPGEGSPFDPLLRFFGGKYSARCGARPGARPLDPARFFVKKRGKKLLYHSPTRARGLGRMCSGSFSFGYGR